MTDSLRHASSASLLLLSLFALHDHFFPSSSPASLCNDTCGVISDQAEAKLALPHLLFELLAVLTRHLPRYVAACLAWLWPIGLVFLILPVAFVALLVFNRSPPFRSTENLRGAPGETNLSKDELLRRLMAVIWEAHGQAFHGYEVVGMEKLPPPGEGAFLIYYHGTLPLDAYYFMARHIILRHRHPIPVVDRFLFRLPGLQQILRLTCALEGSVEECVSLLNSSLAEVNRSHHANNNTQGSSECQPDKDGNSSRSGQVLLLSPGGVREAIFSDEYYSLLWGKRRGFARIAIKAKRPIYPVFTENIREGVRVVQYGKHWLRRLYELTRLPICLYYGYFPVKLRTHIGDPIYPFDGESDEQLADRTREAIEDMIVRYQWRPSNLIIALLQRIPRFDAWVQRRNEQNYHSKRKKTA
ncbi:unnamed protein product [Hymenolepis diminuta]|uniref:PlsC domain-containing protein n=1 Tax=Hymenolepis diminuta TaxID=6216 RepID=A0A158QFL3_HYMDI|nr:unnamed protein product [Hymenolepis diminuta]